jgi:hypothetical protein
MVVVFYLKPKKETTAFSNSRLCRPKTLTGFLNFTFILKPIHLLEHPKYEAHPLADTLSPDITAQSPIKLDL